MEGFIVEKQEEEVTDQQLNKMIEQDCDVIEKFNQKNEWKEAKRTILLMTV
jgi:hemoglobin-like flavoprotein